MLTKDPASSAQPVAVFGGDFNCNAVKWAQSLKKEVETQVSRRTVQVCTSKAIPIHKGDQAIVFNAYALQEASGWGKSHIHKDKPPPFSDAHDVVLVPLCWDDSRTNSSAAQPASPKPLDSPSVSHTVHVAVSYTHLTLPTIYSV